MSVGDLRFDVPNRYLVFPFQGSDKPFDRDVCSDPAQADLAKNAFMCRTTQESFFFKVPVPIFVSKGDAAETSTGMLGWGQRYVFEDKSVEKFGRLTFPGMIRRRAPELDTRDYAAFVESYGDDAIAKMSKILPEALVQKSIASAAGQSFLVRKDADARYRRLTCTKVRATGRTFFDLDCTARTPYLADRFPRATDGTYPYSIVFGLTGTEIDDAPAIGAAVTSRMDSFLERTR